jgi:ABC-type Fe3+/spermidine/putrescine transport system ATPase subunit
MITLKDISFSYKDKPVLKELSLDFKDNQINCLLGGSGSGKTSILRLIAGLEIPQRGTVKIDEVVVSENQKILIPPHKRNLGFIFQDLALWPHFTVYKNIAFGLKERKEKNIKEQLEKMLDLFNLTEHQNKYPHQLSGGQKQLVAIARAMVLKPKILLMDEPLSNLDVKLKRKMLTYIKKLRTEFDLTILYVTHDHKEAFALADQITLLNEGKIAETGTVEQIKKSNNTFVNYFLEY